MEGKIHENIAKKVEHVSSIALTSDLWSNRRMKSNIGITGNFIFDCLINSIIVACHRFSGRHSTCNIYDKFQEMKASFKINKISTFTTANAYKMVNAKVISEVSTIVSHVSKSTVATNVLFGGNRSESSVPTRWNLQLLMIKSILKVDQDK